MIGYNVDVTNLEEKQAFEYIKRKCADCDRAYDCTGSEAVRCETKVNYLMNKFGNVHKNLLKGTVKSTVNRTL